VQRNAQRPLFLQGARLFSPTGGSAALVFEKVMPAVKKYLPA
jgi:hypothetical protein